MARFTVLWLLTPLKMTYETAKKRADPYNKIVEELPRMRRDSVELVKKAVKQKRRECTLTIQALRNALQVETTRALAISDWACPDSGP